jgi:hypothetical protein
MQDKFTRRAALGLGVSAAALTVAGASAQLSMMETAAARSEDRMTLTNRPSGAPADVFIAHSYPERSIDLGEISMNYVVSGSEAKPSLLLIPGQTASWWSYESTRTSRSMPSIFAGRDAAAGRRADTRSTTWAMTLCASLRW